MRVAISSHHRASPRVEEGTTFVGDVQYAREANI